RRELDVLEGDRQLDVRRSESEVLDDSRRSIAQLPGRELLVFVAPAPEAPAPARRRGRCAADARAYQCTPLIRCANATPSAETSSSFPFSPRAAWLSGNSLKAVLRITSTDFGASAERTSPKVPSRVATFFGL